MNKLIILAAAALVSSNALAATIKLDCGRAMNVPRTVVINEKETDGYTHTATYKTSGRDEVTGMLKGVTHKMAGQMDLSTEFTGKETSVLALVSLKSPLFQLVITKPTSNKAAPIPAMEINLATQSVTKFDCFLK